jgi:FtsZ-binding cell division protein ZapB
MSATKKDWIERVTVLERRLANVHDNNATLSAKLAEAERERDALKREAVEAQQVLADLMSWFADKPSPPEWRIAAGKYGADDAVAAARAFVEKHGRDG